MKSKLKRKFVKYFEISFLFETCILPVSVTIPQSNLHGWRNTKTLFSVSLFFLFRGFSIRFDTGCVCDLSSSIENCIWKVKHALAASHRHRRFIPERRTHHQHFWWNAKFSFMVIGFFFLPIEASVILVGRNSDKPSDSTSFNEQTALRIAQFRRRKKSKNRVNGKTRN